MFLNGVDVSRSCVGSGVRAPLLWGHRAIHRPPGMTGTCTCRSSALFVSSGLECQVLLASPLLKIPIDPSKPSSSGTTLQDYTDTSTRGCLRSRTQSYSLCWLQGFTQSQGGALQKLVP